MIAKKQQLDMCGIRKVLLISVVNIILLALASNSSFAAWTKQLIDGKQFSNMSSRSIVLEKNTNFPHVVYGKTQLFHAYFNGSSWKTQIVDRTPDVGEYASIALDQNNNVHISYYSSANGNLKYASNVSGSWVTKILDSVGDVGQYSSIAVDSAGKVHISYYDVTNGNLKYISNDASGSWIKQIVDRVDDVGKFSSLAVDSAGKVHISYYDVTNGNIRFFRKKVEMRIRGS